jgi:hypothetical protein
MEIVYSTPGVKITFTNEDVEKGFLFTDTFEEKHAAKVKELKEHAKVITELDFTGCTEIIFVPSFINIEDCPELRVLNFSDCEVMMSLPHRLRSCTKLETLILDGCGSLKPFTIAQLPPFLLHLEVSGTNLQPISEEDLKQRAWDNTPKKIDRRQSFMLMDQNPKRSDHPVIMETSDEGGIQYNPQISPAPVIMRRNEDIMRRNEEEIPDLTPRTVAIPMMQNHIKNTCNIS